MAKTFKDDELRAVIAEMSSQLDAVWQISKSELLAKAAPEDKDKPDGGGSPEADPASSDSSAPASDPAASAAPAPAESAPADPSMGAPGGAPGGAPAGAMGDPAAQQDQPLTPEALQAEYSQLAPEELDMHIKAALAAKEALAASASAMAPDAASAAPAGAPAGAPAPMAMKGEMSEASSSSSSSSSSIGKGEFSSATSSEDSIDKDELSQGGMDHNAAHKDQINQKKGSLPPGGMSHNVPSKDAIDKGELHGSYNKNSGGKISGGKMAKSEDPRDSKIAELEALVKAQSDNLQMAHGDIENLTTAVKMVLERPERKAVTTVAALVKGESTGEEKTMFTPAEAQQRLRDLIPTLNKSERDLVGEFYAGKVKASALAPIFEAHASKK